MEGSQAKHRSLVVTISCVAALMVVEAALLEQGGAAAAAKSVVFPILA